MPINFPFHTPFDSKLEQNLNPSKFSKFCGTLFNTQIYCNSMLKLCSNGVVFQNHFSLHLKTVFLYSTSSSIAESKRPLTVDFMVKSLKFSNDEAFTAWNKVSPSKLSNSAQKPDLVVDFLKKRGFDDTQIKKLVTSVPEMLHYRVDETLIPKFDALEEMGVLGSDLVDVIASNSSILRRGMNTKIVPMINYVKSIVGSSDDFLKILRRSYWLMSADVATKFQPNINLFKKYGFTDEKILRIIVHNVDIFGHDPKRLEEVLIRVDKELGISPDLPTFPTAVVLLASLSEATLEMKFGIYKSFGWTDSEIKLMLRKSPKCFGLSEKVIRERLSFYMYELGCQPGYLASRPYVMTYSLKHRVVPRYTLLKVLKERKLVTREVGMLTAVCSCESAFLKKYVLPFKDELPELCNAYISREQVTSTS